MNELDPLAVPTSGIVLIEASAGTGKTHTVTTLFVRLLVEQRLVVSQILVVTFTQAAAAELRERVRRRLRQALEYLEPGSAATDPELLGLFMGRPDRERDRECLRAALASFDEASIFTIHGYCQRALDRHAFESGVRFDLRLVTDPKPMILEWVRDFWLCEVGQVSVAQVRYLKARGLSLDALYRLARMVVAWPDLPIEPATASARPGALVDTLGAYASLCQHARSVYFGKDKAGVVSGLGVRDRVREILRGADTLKANVYSAETRLRLADELDRYLGAEDLVPRSAFSKITQSRLDAGTLKGKAPPQHPFFELCERLGAAGAALDRELEAWVLEFLLQFIRRARQGVAEQHAKNGTQSFDDLLHGLLHALRSDRGGRGGQRPGGSLGQATRSRASRGAHRRVSRHR